MSYNPEEQAGYVEEFRRRAEAKIPPGYKDNRKDDEGIGDFLIWKTLLKVGQDRKMHLAFVTGEQKGDWFVRADGGPVFPRIELVDEYRRASGGKLVRLLSLHELLRELGATPAVVKTIEQAEEIANSEVRAIRPTRPNVILPFQVVTTSFWLPVGSSNSFAVPTAPQQELLRIHRPASQQVTILS